MKPYQAIFSTILFLAAADSRACENCGGKDKGAAKPTDATSGVKNWQNFKPGAPLEEPEVRRSVNGVLDTTLTASYAWRDVRGGPAVLAQL